MPVIDFDRIEEWSPWFTEAIGAIAPFGLLEELRALHPEYIEDARDFLRDRLGIDAITNQLTTSLSGCRVRVYHGTRLDLDQIALVKEVGLRPLQLADRKSAIVRIASLHPRWRDVEGQLDRVLNEIGPGRLAGHREDGSVHVCFSRSGLINGCNHYLTHGAEVDNHVFDALFGRDGRDYLPAQRQPVLFSFEPTFDETARAANPWGFPSDDFPSLIRILLGLWAYRQTDPKFESASLEDCSAAKFERPIAAEEITGVEFVDNVLLRPR